MQKSSTGARIQPQRNSCSVTSTDHIDRFRHLDQAQLLEYGLKRVGRNPFSLATMVYDWENKEEICYRMYIEEKKSLEEIMEYMKEEHKFAPRYARRSRARRDRYLAVPQHSVALHLPVLTL
jgi:hypothetical protein